jgi:hypothetical protein
MRAVLTDMDEPAWLDDGGKLLLRAARHLAQNCELARTNVLSAPHHVQWFPWIGTRGVLTLRAFASAAHIPNEIDRLSIIYHMDSERAFLEHLASIVHSSSSAGELASHIPVKAMQKFDNLLPPELLDLANGHDHLDLGDARRAAKQALAEAG